MRSADRAFATALMERFGVERALIGDVIEQWRNGRADAWFWRQALAAICSAGTRHVMAHPLRSTMAALVALLLRDVTIRAWGSYEPSIDMGIGNALLGVGFVSRPVYVVAISWANALLLAPVWFGMGVVVERLSRGAVLLFVPVALALMLPGIARQLEHTMASDMIRWLLPVQLAVFGGSIAGFALSTLSGAACAHGERHEIA